ncbi:hypothetical protein BH11PSE4_BH11PSE4_25220 [soil metagenome]
MTGDGEHRNPERETLEMALGEDDTYSIHLTCPLEQIDVTREADWIKEQNRRRSARRTTRGRKSATTARRRKTA